MSDSYRRKGNTLIDPALLATAQGAGTSATEQKADKRQMHVENTCSTMKRITIVYSREVLEVSEYDEPPLDIEFVNELRDAGFEDVRTVILEDSKSTKYYPNELVLLRCFDTPETDHARFMELFENMDRRGAKLTNSLDILKSFQSKHYKVKLVSEFPHWVVGTLISCKDRPFEDFKAQILSLMEADGSDAFVIKPVFGNSGMAVMKVLPENVDDLETTHFNRFDEVILEPYLRQVDIYPEKQLIFVNGKFVSGRQKPAGFCMPAFLKSYYSPNEQEIDICSTILKQAMKDQPRMPFYARVDYIADLDSFALMEIDAYSPLVELHGSEYKTMRGVYVKELLARVNQKVARASWKLNPVRMFFENRTEPRRGSERVVKKKKDLTSAFHIADNQRHFADDLQLLRLHESQI